MVAVPRQQSQMAFEGTMPIETGLMVSAKM